jgi:hypothetical protein
MVKRFNKCRHRAARSLYDGRWRLSTPRTIAAHSIALAANAFDIEMSQHAFKNGCVEGGFGEPGGRPHTTPGRAEMYAVDLTSDALLFFLDWVVQRSNPPKALRWMPYAVSVFITQAHIRGGLHDVGKCW